MWEYFEHRNHKSIDHINVCNVTARSHKVVENEEEKTTDNEPMKEVVVKVKENKKQPEKCNVSNKAN